MRSPGNIYKSDGFKVHGVLYLEVVFDHRVEYPIGVSWDSYTACYVYIYSMLCSHVQDIGNPMILATGRYTACYVHMFRTEEVPGHYLESFLYSMLCPHVQVPGHYRMSICSEGVTQHKQCILNLIL